MLRKFGARRAAHARNWMTRIRSRVPYDERLSFRAADGLFDHRTDFCIAGFLIDDAVAHQHAACVRVHNEDWMIAGIEQNGVGGFRDNAVQVQQLCSELCGRRGEHSGERTGIMPVEERDECLKITRFLAEVTEGRANVSSSSSGIERMAATVS